MARAEQRKEQRVAEDAFVPFRDTGDRFYVDPLTIPDGMSYEWKRLTMMGQEDRRHMVNLGRNKWVPVPSERHPEIGGDPTPDKDGRAHPHAGSIIVDGLMLMERPLRITQIVQQQDDNAARGQVGNQVRRLKLVPDGTLSDDSKNRNVRFQKERDLSIPEDFEQS